MYRTDIQYNYGKGHEGHGWVEVGDFVYDPSLMLKFDKETYYSYYVIPEPSTYAMIFGALALGFVAYRRRK